MLLLCENHTILTLVILSQYTRVTDDKHMTIVGHCNAIATFS